MQPLETLTEADRIASRQREAWIETEVRAWVAEQEAGIASRQREAWIETTDV